MYGLVDAMADVGAARPSTAAVKPVVVPAGLIWPSMPKQLACPCNHAGLVNEAQVPVVELKPSLNTLVPITWNFSVVPRTDEIS
jgi:hypothetical protein